MKQKFDAFRLFFLAAIVMLLPLALEAEPPESQPSEAGPPASVRFVITNQGVDVEGKGTYVIYPVGERKKELGYAYSGAEAHIPAGTYDVLIRYQDDAVNKEIWLEKKKLDGKVDESVELDLKLAEVRYTIINNGVPAGSKGRFLLFTPGKKSAEVASAPSGTAIKVGAGVYDVLLRFEDETAKKEKWQRKVKMEGSVEKTVAFDVMAESQPVETQPATRPAETRPAETRPAETRPAETRPAETRPSPQTQPTTQPAAPPPPPVPIAPAPETPKPAIDGSIPQTALPPPVKEKEEEKKEGWGCGLR